MKTAVVSFKDVTRQVRRYYKVGRIRYEGAFVIIPWEGEGWHGDTHEDAYPAADVFAVEVKGEE